MTPTGVTGEYEYLIEFYHQTQAWVQHVLNQLDALGLSVTLRTYIDEFKTISGRIWSRTPSNKAHSTWGYGPIDTTETSVKIVDINNRKYYVKTVATIRLGKGIGVAGKRATLGDLGPGGHFSELGGDWYEYKYVVSVNEYWAIANDVVAAGGGAITYGSAIQVY